MNGKQTIDLQKKNLMEKTKKIKRKGIREKEFRCRHRLSNEYKEDFGKMIEHLKNNTLDEFQSGLHKKTCSRRLDGYHSDYELISVAVSIVREEEERESRDISTSDFFLESTEQQIYRSSLYLEDEMSFLKEEHFDYIDNLCKIKKSAVLLAMFILSLTAVFLKDMVQKQKETFNICDYETYTNYFLAERENLNEELLSYYVPKFIPEGFSEIYNIQNDHFNKAKYVNMNGDFIVYEQMPESGYLYLHSGNADLERICFDGYDILYYDRSGIKVFLFNRLDHNFKIITTLDKEEAIKILLSISERPSNELLS